MARYADAEDAAPERARWPRLVATPRPELRSLLRRRYAGFTEATAPRHLVLPAAASVPLVVKLLDSPHRPPRFVRGARGAYWAVEGDCAPSYLEVWLAPLAAYTLVGLPIDELGGQTVDLVDLLGGAGRRLGEQLREAPPGADGSRCWTSSCCGGWRTGRDPRRRSPGPGGGWSRPVARSRSAGSPPRSAGATGT